MSLEQKQTENEKLKYFLTMGAEMAGGAAGAALGLITLNPALTVILGAAGAGIGKGLVDVVDKQLSTREKSRTAVAAAESIVSIHEGIQQGMIIREDGFFDSNEVNRSSCEEIFEGMLLSAKNEHEEKKIKYIANIFSNTLFNSITIGEANHILKIATDLTYRQICVLSLVEQKKKIPQISLGKVLAREEIGLEESITNESIFLREEIMELYHKGLIYVELNDRPFVLLSCFDIVPDNIMFTPLGSLCYSIMGLGNIPDQDLIEIGDLLKI